MKVKKIVIPVAGLGTRLLPISKSGAKEMVPVFDTPALQLVIEEAVDAGISEVIIITSPDKKKILKKYFDFDKKLDQKLRNNKSKKEFYDALTRINKLPKIKYVIQRKPNGLAMAILKAARYIKKEPFVVALADEAYVYNKNDNVIASLIKNFEKTNCSTLLSKEVSKKDVSKYGIIIPQKARTTNLKQGIVKAIIEKPKYEDVKSQFASLGRYLFTHKIFSKIKAINVGKSGEYELPSAVSLLQMEEKVHFVITKNQHFDLGNKLGYAKAFYFFSLKSKERKELSSFLENINKK